MRRALEEAERAGKAGEIPVGAVVVDPNGLLLAAAGNSREQTHDPSNHAEIVAMRQAGQRLGTWQLSGCLLYVTLEPCLMCAGAISQARLAYVIYGADDPKAGALGSVMNVFASNLCLHRPQVLAGICEEPCRHLMATWFEQLRIPKEKISNFPKISQDSQKSIGSGSSG
jgi:tRNA(adenine34) deaminase